MGFAASAEISLDPVRFDRYLARSVESELDLAEFGGFHVALRWKIKNIAESGGLQWISRSSLSKNLWISPNIVDFMVRLGGSGFWGGNPPADLK